MKSLVFAATTLLLVFAAAPTARADEIDDATGNLTQMGVGTMVASGNGWDSQFATVSKVKPDRKHNTINIHNGLFHNQVFVGDEDFDFVYNYIKEHCPRL